VELIDLETYSTNEVNDLNEFLLSFFLTVQFPIFFNTFREERVVTALVSKSSIKFGLAHNDVSSHSLSPKLSTSVLTTWSITCEPWNYAAPHIIRDDTDVRIIEREDSPPSPSYPAWIHPRPDGRTRQRVKQCQFGCKSSSILHFVIRPAGWLVGRSARRGKNRRLLVQESVTAQLRSDAQEHHSSRDYSMLPLSTRNYINQRPGFQSNVFYSDNTKSKIGT